MLHRQAARERAKGEHAHRVLCGGLLGDVGLLNGRLNGLLSVHGDFRLCSVVMRVL